VDGARVFVLSSGGVLACHACADGTLLWRLDLVEQAGVDPQYYGFAASPILHSGALWVAADRLFALDPASGEILRASEPLGARYATPAPLAIGGEPRLAVFGQDSLQLVDPGSAEVHARFPWHASEPRVNAATPVVVGERVFVSSAYDQGCALLELGPEGLRPVFQNKLMRNKMAGCVLVDGALYGFDESVLVCLDLEGHTRWRVRGLGNGAIAGGDGKLALTSSAGELVIADASPDAFHERARVPLFDEGVCWTPPVIAAGRILVRNNRGTLVCRDHRRGPDSGLEPLREATLAELPAAEVLVERHLDALGGRAAVDAHPRVRLRGEHELRSVGFVPGPFEILAEAPDRRRVWIRLPPPLDGAFAHAGEPGAIVRVHDGRESFERNRYRGDKLYSGGEAREEAVAARLAFAREPADLGTALVSEARVLFDERACFRVAARAPDGEPRTLYFEEATGLLAGREGQHEALVVYRDYRAFDGLLVPTSVRVFRPDGGLEEHFRVEEVEFPGEIPEGAFARGERVEELLREREKAK